MSLNAFDLATFGGGLSYRYPLTRGNIHYGADFDFTSQGDLQRQRGISLHIAGSYAFSTSQTVVTRYRRGAVAALESSFEYVSGQRDSFEVDWILAGVQRHLSVFAQYDYNDRNDYYENKIFVASASPSRFVLGAAADAIIWSLEARVMSRFAVSLYGDADLVGNEIHRQRRDETGELQASLAWPMSKNTRVSADYQLAWNRSVISRYGYAYNQLSVGFRWAI